MARITIKQDVSPDITLEEARELRTKLHAKAIAELERQNESIKKSLENTLRSELTKSIALYREGRISEKKMLNRKELFTRRYYEDLKRRLLDESGFSVSFKIIKGTSKKKGSSHYARLELLFDFKDSVYFRRCTTKVKEFRIPVKEWKHDRKRGIQKCLDEFARQCFFNDCEIDESDITYKLKSKDNTDNEEGKNGYAIIVSCPVFELGLKSGEAFESYDLWEAQIEKKNKKTGETTYEYWCNMYVPLKVREKAFKAYSILKDSHAKEKSFEASRKIAVRRCKHLKQNTPTRGIRYTHITTFIKSKKDEQ